MFQTMHLWVSNARWCQHLLTTMPYTPVLVNQALRLHNTQTTGTRVSRLGAPQPLQDAHYRASRSGLWTSPFGAAPLPLRHMVWHIGVDPA